MGSLIHKLDYLAETKVKIRQALQRAGSKVTEQDTFRSYADYISKIDTSPVGTVSELHANGGSAEGIAGAVNYKKVYIRNLIPGDGTVVLTWTPIEVATNYRLFTYLNGRYTRVGDTTTTSYAVTGLTNDTEYGFYVKAYAYGAWQEVTSEERTELTEYATPSASLRSLSELNLDDNVREDLKKNSEESNNRKSEENIEEKKGGIDNGINIKS